MSILTNMYVNEQEREKLKTETGRLMSSGRVNSSEITYQEHEMADLRSRLSRLEGVIGSLNQQYAQLLSTWIALHPFEASQVLKVHPDNLANHLELASERSGC